MKQSPKAGHSHLLNKVVVGGMTIAIVILFATAVFYTRFALQSGQMAAVVTSTLVSLSNENREKQHLAALTPNPLLEAAAQAKANDMAEKGYFSHTTPEGYASWYWFQKVGYEYSYAGENLAVNFSDSNDVSEGWMESPTHRANILNGKFTEIGIATAVGMYKGKSTTFVVQMFGTPKGAVPVAQASGVAAAFDSEPEEVTEPISILGTTTGEVEGVEIEAPDEESFAYDKADLWEKAAASPKSTLKIAYIGIGGVLLLLLVGVAGFEFKRHHARHAIVVALLICLMIALYFVIDTLLFAEPVVV